MTTPIILNVVIVTTKHLLHVYHCQQSILVQCSLSSIFRPMTVFKFKWLLKILVCWFWGARSQRAHCLFGGRPKGHIRAPKGRSALWKRPSKSPALHLRMSVYRVTSLIKFPVINYKRVCVLGKQNFCLFLWFTSCHKIFHTLCSAVYTCSNLDWRRFVMALFRSLHPIDSVPFPKLSRVWC